MKILKANQLNMTRLDSHLKRYAKSEGLLMKKPIETLIDFKIILRPFRRVIFDVESATSNEQGQVHSLIDEALSQIISDENHRMLLWRPKYATSQVCEYDSLEDMNYYNGSDAELHEVINEMMNLRWKCQDLDEEYRPKLRRLQADPLSALGIIIPRRSSSLRQEQDLVDERKESHAYILASSLITNSSLKDIITKSFLGERIYIETIVARFEEEGSKERLLILETPNANSLDDAYKAGKALTRLCELYIECRDRVAGTPISDS